MAIFRGALPLDDYAIMPRHWFRDPRLSGKAKGYMGYISTHSPDYRLTVDQIIAEMRESKDAVYAGLEELVRYEYLIRTQGTDERNKFTEVDYHFGPAAAEVQFDRAWPRGARKASPVGKPGSVADQARQDVSAGQPGSGFSGSGKPGSGKPESKKTQPKKTQGVGVEKEDQNPPPLSSPATHYAPATPPPAATVTAPPAPAEVATGGDFGPKGNPHTDTPRPGGVDALAEALAALCPAWQPATTRAVLVELVNRNAYSPLEIERVMRAAAAGEYGPTGSPRRMLTWWPVKASVMAAPAPEWAQGPFRHLAEGTPMCRVHRGEPAAACGRCKSDRLGADVDVEPARHAAEADGLSGAALARQVARKAKTERAPHKGWTPDAPPAPQGPPPESFGTVLGRLAESFA